MVIEYKDRDWLYTRPGQAIEDIERVPKIPCPGCGVLYARTTVEQHAWKDRCQRVIWRNELERKGWLKTVRRFKGDFETPGLIQRNNQVTMMPLWVTMVVNSATRRFIPEAMLLQWLITIRDNDALRSLVVKLRTDRKIGYPATYLTFVAMCCDVNSHARLTFDRTTHHGKGLGATSVLSMLNMLAEHLEDGDIEFTHDELQELNTMANAVDVFAQKMFAANGPPKRNAIDFVAVLHRRAKELRTLCREQLHSPTSS